MKQDRVLKRRSKRTALNRASRSRGGDLDPRAAQAEIADIPKDGDNSGSSKTSKSSKKLGRLRRKKKAAEVMARQLQQQLEDQPNFPVARPASMQRRHWGIVASFFLLVLAPLLAVVFYLWTIAEDQYVSTAGFIVRSQETSASADALSGLGGLLAGGSTASDSDVLYAFIQSQEMVEAVETGSACASIFQLIGRRTGPLRSGQRQPWRS